MKKAKKLSWKSLLTKKKPEKRLVLKLKKRAGRSKAGRITVRHRGGGAKRLYRMVDFAQGKMDMPGKVIALEYDPYRTAFLALVEYSDGKKSYRLAPNGVKVGEEVIVAEKGEIKVGNRLKLKNIPIGANVFNVELMPGRGGQIVRSAGTSAQVLAQDGKYTHLLLPSKETRKVLSECFATIGQVSRPGHRYERLRKAGQTRLKGKRPQVRGTVMSPRAHPHGGGEGKTPIGMPYPKTPWGKPARGVRTRKRKWTDKYIIKKRK